MSGRGREKEQRAKMGSGEGLNGDLTLEHLEQRMITTEVRAIRAEQGALAATNGLMVVEQRLGSIDRELKAVRGEVKVGYANVRDQIQKIHDRLPAVLKREEPSLSYEDFEETSPGGSHYKITKDTVSRVLGEKARDEDAKKWRELWRRVRWAVLLLAGGALTWGGERLIETLSRHL